MKGYEETIERLKAVSGNYGAHDINVAFMGSEIWYPSELRDALVELLRDTNPSRMTDTELDEYGVMHMPRGADGKTIRLGDMVRHKDDGKSVYRVNRLVKYEGNGKWGSHWLIDVVDEGGANCRSGHGTDFIHYYEPTVEDILAEFENEWDEVAYANADEREGFANDAPSLIIKYAEKLSKLMEKDES